MFALLATGMFAGASAAGTDISVYFRTGSPPAARISVDLGEPQMQPVRGTRVYYTTTDTYDVYRYGRFYYIYDDGYWYRSRAPRGQFVFVQLQYVPRAVISVPQDYRRHWREQERPYRRQHPGHRGTSPGYGGTPPGHGGTPPGHGGTPPGHGGTPPGQDKHHQQQQNNDAASGKHGDQDHRDRH